MVAAALRARDVPFALIGAAAMAVHGVSRSTADLDLLAVDRRCLDADFWSDLRGAATLDVRRGDDTDPLAGIVRFTAEGEADVDLVIGKPVWQADCVARAALRIEDDVPVVTLADLMLLKLYAGGSQDAWDLEQLLAVDRAGEAARAVDERITDLPGHARALWNRLR